MDTGPDVGPYGAHVLRLIMWGRCCRQLPNSSRYPLQASSGLAGAGAGEHIARQLNAGSELSGHGVLAIPAQSCQFSWLPCEFPASTPLWNPVSGRLWQTLRTAGIQTCRRTVGQICLTCSVGRHQVRSCTTSLVIRGEVTALLITTRLGIGYRLPGRAEHESQRSGTWNRPFRPLNLNVRTRFNNLSVKAAESLPRGFGHL